MGSIAEKIEKIYESKIAIKNSLINKGLKVDDTLGNYAAAIDSLSVGATIETNSENLTTENKKDGDIVVVYDSASTETTTATVFKVVDTAEDIYILDGKELHIPNLGALLALDDFKSGIFAIHFNPSNNGYDMDTYDCYAVPNENVFFYDDVPPYNASVRTVHIGNTNSYAVNIKEYYCGPSRVEDHWIAAGTEEIPGTIYTGTLTVYGGSTFYYINCKCYTDVNRTSVMFDSSTLEKVSNLEYTQIS